MGMYYEVQAELCAFGWFTGSVGEKLLSLEIAIQKKRPQPICRAWRPSSIGCTRIFYILSMHEL